MPEGTQGRGTLFVGGLAAILASTCCLGPLVLLMLGISGACIANLTALEPYRLFVVGVAAVALLMSSRQIFRPAVACQSGDVCAVPHLEGAHRENFTLRCCCSSRPREPGVGCAQDCHIDSV